jgi:hypothetical protein
MWLGRFQLGVEVVLPVQCTDAAEAPSWPDTAPAVEVWSDSAKVLARLMPAAERQLTTGLFRLPLFLAGQFAAGRYTAIARWENDAFNGVDIHHFEIVPGGNQRGAVIAMAYFEKAGTRFIVQQLDGGTIVRGKNPRV